MEIALPILVSVGVFVVVVAVVIGRQRRLNESMRRIAVELGMTYGTPAGVPGSGWGGEPGASGFRGFLATLAPWRLEGTHRAVAVACYPITRGGTRSSSTTTVVEALLPSPLGLGLYVGKETALTRLGKAVLNLQDITVGEARFDAAARVKGRDLAGIKALLAEPAVRERILQALEYAPTVTVTDAGARFERQANVTDAAVYRRVIDLLTAIVEAIGEARKRG